MIPIIFNTAEEQSCLSTYTRTNWTGNWNYWTGGLLGCRGLWGWCFGATFIPIPENLTWALNQPDLIKGDENCLHMRIHKNDSSTALSDRNCSDKYIYACKAKSLTLVETNKVECPGQCAKDPTLFDTNQTVKDPYLQGDWYTSFGRHLFFPNISATWSDAWNYCCLFGMQLVTIDTSSRHAALSKFAKKYDPLINVEHWTSASGDNSGGHLTWCNGNTSLDVKETNWKDGQPKFSDGRCVFVQFSNSSANRTTFSLGDCTQKRKFLCERKMAMSDADLQQKECMFIFGISNDDLKQWKTENFSTSNATQRIKCFIKCIGELNGLLLLGKLELSIDALRVIGEISSTPAELQMNMGIVDECGNPTTSGDECARAAEIYECGRQKAPDVTEEIRKQLTSDRSIPPSEGNRTYPNLETEERFCRTRDLPCLVNNSLRQQLLDTNSTAMGAWYIGDNGKKYFKSNMQGGNAVSWRIFHNYCCSLGLQMAEFATYQDLQVVKAGGVSLILIGETFIDGQQRDVWCNSKIPITDKTMYKSNMPGIRGGGPFTKETTCYRVLNSNNTSTMFLGGDGCLLDAMNSYSATFLCE